METLAPQFIHVGDVTYTSNKIYAYGEDLDRLCLEPDLIGCDVIAFAATTQLALLHGKVADWPAWEPYGSGKGGGIQMILDRPLQEVANQGKMRFLARIPYDFYRLYRGQEPPLEDHPTETVRNLLEAVKTLKDWAVQDWAMSLKGLPLTEDELSLTYANALKLLGALRGRPALLALVGRWVTSGQETLRIAAYWMIGAQSLPPTEAGEFLLQLVDEVDPRYAGWLMAWGVTYRPDRAGLLLPKLDHPNRLVRRFAIGALGFAQYRSAAPRIAEFLTDRDYYTAREAVNALGALCHRDYLDRIREMLGHPEAIVKAMAMSAMADLMGASVLPELEEFAGQDMYLKMALEAIRERLAVG